MHDSCLHLIKNKSSLTDGRGRMNNPFYYTPDTLTMSAAEEVKRLIATHEEWRDEVAKGKMFGVLVVEDATGRMGFLAAFSGQIGGREDWEGFVPAVFDYLQEDGYFKTEEQEISAINHRIDELEGSADYLSAKSHLEEIHRKAATEEESYKEQMRQAKERRDAHRPTATPDEQAVMIRESQYMKAELRRMKRRHQEQAKALEEAVRATEEEVTLLRRERKQRSDALQQWLFRHFVMCNGHGEERTLLDIFAPTPQGIPPSGAGECCAPKLLQHAFLHGYHPLRIGEFWQGASPTGEIRRHDHFYPACRGKCLPILRFMLQGLDVAPNPLEQSTDQTLEVVYDDEQLVVVNKPAGMLAVPGKSARDSVYSILRRRYPQAEGPMVVHRLDMATSGLMVVAKTTWMYHALQRLFEQRRVEKRYVALLERDISHEVPPRGTISLPLRPDVMDRPRQVVDEKNGKEAVTDYEILGVDHGHTLIALYPRTGRTHQLRVHCAHPQGLDCPILGDTLYGTPADRLHLHAERLAFVHPLTGERMKFTYSENNS